MIETRCIEPRTTPDEIEMTKKQDKTNLLMGKQANDRGAAPEATRSPAGAVRGSVLASEMMTCCVEMVRMMEAVVVVVVVVVVLGLVMMFNVHKDDDSDIDHDC
jgi:hypothetical protein